jgi:hypothetical protein
MVRQAQFSFVPFITDGGDGLQPIAKFCLPNRIYQINWIASFFLQI